MSKNFTYIRINKNNEKYTQAQKDSLDAYIEKNKKGQGTMSFDQCLTDLYKEGKITMEEAKKHATSSEDFERNLMFGEE